MSRPEKTANLKYRYENWRGDTLAAAPSAFAQFLSERGYHPRSSAHGDKLCQLLLDDLLSGCSPLREFALSQGLVHRLNLTLNPGKPMSWNLDLVVGPARGPRSSALPLPNGTPEDIWLAIDAKTIMTEHGKARRNRQRDLNSLHDILHRQNPRMIVGGLVVVNIAQRFRSPLRPDTTSHRNIERLVEGTVQMIRDLPRAPPEGGPGLDAVGVIVVKHTNLPGDRTSVVEVPPAPPLGDPVHYETFLKDLCNAVRLRYYM